MSCAVSFWRPSAATLAAVVALLLLGGAATAAPPTLQLTQVGQGFSNPVYVTSTSADPPAIYVVEQGGRVWRVVNGVTDPLPFLNISSKVHFAGELGLFSIAFSPTYASDHFVYAYYINRKVRVTVSRFKVSGTSAKETTLLTVQSSYHDHTNGDCAVIGGYVYRGSAMPDEVGRYFYADLCTGTVWSMAAGGGDNRVEAVTVNFPVSFGTDSVGELYVVSSGDGKVYRLSE
jgi:hypothetical protein